MKLITAFALLLAGACGLAMTLCGGAFTANALADGGWPILLISLPSLGFGAYVLWFVVMRLRALTRP